MYYMYNISSLNILRLRAVNELCMYVCIYVCVCVCVCDLVLDIQCTYF